MKELEVGKQYKQALIDAETGELLMCEEFTHGTLHTYEQKAVYYQKNEDDPRTFLNVKVSAFPVLADRLTCTQLGHAVYMASYMNYDGTLYRYENSKFPMTRKELAEVMQVSQRTLSRTLNQLKDSKTLSEVTVSVHGKRKQAFKMNSAYFFRGGRQKTGKAGVTAKLFTETMRQLYKQNGAARTGFFCKLLPYLDKPLGVAEIAKITDVSISNVSDYLRSMSYENKFAFARLSAGTGKSRKLLFIMSPELASRTKGIPTAEIMKYFDVLNAA